MSVVVLCLGDNYPSELVFDDYTGSLSSVFWKKGIVYHRENDLPAYISYYKDSSLFNIAWYKSGVLHRENNQPSSIIYYQNGNTYQEKYVKGFIYHCLFGPAIIERNENGVLNREWYYIEGKKMLKNEWLNNPLVVRSLKNDTSGNIVSDVSF